MFYANMMHWPNVVNNCRPAGVILHPSRFNLISMLKAIDNNISNTLIDPQLYLLNLGINPSRHRKLIRRMATYPWFGISPNDDCDKTTDDHEQKMWAERSDVLSNWEATVRIVVAVQEAAKCSRIILPDCLINDPLSKLEDHLVRLDESIDIVDTFGNISAPLYATIALSYADFANESMLSMGVIDAIADGFSARRKLSGVYVIVAGDTHSTSYTASLPLAETILTLTSLLSSVGLEVVVNFVDMLGFVACSLGATAYGTGYLTKDKRMCLDDYSGDGFGKAFPKFFSLSTLLELLPKRDLEKLQKANGLDMIKDDITEASRGLYEALSQGKTSAVVQSWNETQNNYSIAVQHYIQRHMKENTILSKEQMLGWLESVEIQGALLQQKIGNTTFDQDTSFIPVWREAINKVSP